VINSINSSDAGVNLTYNTLEDKFVLTAKNYGTGNDITMSDKSGSNFLNVLFGATQEKTLGKNAILRVNDTDIQRNSNTFTIDGVTLTLKDTFDTKQTVDVSRNTEQIQTGITGFVTDYNKLIGDINALIHSEASYKDYPPLTSEQKAEMSEKEIELWETKAKEGLLRGDSTISDLLGDMRSTLYSRVEGSKYALYDLGIDTSGDYKDYGKLVIKDSSKLLKAMETDPDSVEKLFNDPVNGLAAKLNTVLNKAVKVSYSSPGSLVSIAGANELVDENSTIGKQLDDLNDRLDRLQDQYSSERERYWKQFNSMETLINQMNQQSTWLASQFG
jgi:flagellar capping protein FliD